MIDPLTVSAVAGGVSLFQRLAGIAGDKASQIAGGLKDAAGTSPAAETDDTSTADESSFEDLLVSARKKAFDKLFDAHPELKEKLGEGPYSLTTSADGTLTVFSTTTGRSVALDPATTLGQQASALLMGLKGSQKAATALTERATKVKTQPAGKDDSSSEILSALQRLSKNASSAAAQTDPLVKDLADNLPADEAASPQTLPAENSMLQRVIQAYKSA